MATSPWRFISHLSLNYLSLIDANERGGRGGAARDARALRGARRSRPGQADRRRAFGARRAARCGVCPRRGPITFGRGLEIQLEVDELAFEGGSAFLLGCVLEQFFARYVSINSFTETVLRSTARGEIMRWVPRWGERPILWPSCEPLAEKPFAYDFFQALRRLECLYPAKPRLGEALRPADEPVRLGQEPSLAFAPAALAPFIRREGRPAAAAGGRASSGCSARTGRCRCT